MNPHVKERFSWRWELRRSYSIPMVLNEQGVANRGASIRVGRDTEKAGKGYFEDRRPASNMDPYVVTSMIANTTILWKPWSPSPLGYGHWFQGPARPDGGWSLSFESSVALCLKSCISSPSVRHSVWLHIVITSNGGPWVFVSLVWSVSTINWQCKNIFYPIMFPHFHNFN